MLVDPERTHLSYPLRVVDQGRPVVHDCGHDRVPAHPVFGCDRGDRAAQLADLAGRPGSCTLGEQLEGADAWDLFGAGLLHTALRRAPPPALAEHQANRASEAVQVAARLGLSALAFCMKRSDDGGSDELVESLPSRLSSAAILPWRWSISSVCDALVYATRRG